MMDLIQILSIKWPPIKLMAASALSCSNDTATSGSAILFNGTSNFINEAANQVATGGAILIKDYALQTMTVILKAIMCAI